MKAWLARNDDMASGGHLDYYLTFTRMPVKGTYVDSHGRRRMYWTDAVKPYNGISLCPFCWVRAGGMKLKPGEGPVHVEISVTCKAAKC